MITSLWRDHMISKSLDIHLIHGDIHGQSCKKLLFCVGDQQVFHVGQLLVMWLPWRLMRTRNECSWLTIHQKLYYDIIWYLIHHYNKPKYLSNFILQKDTHTDLGKLSGLGILSREMMVRYWESMRFHKLYQLNSMAFFSINMVLKILKYGHICCLNTWTNFYS